MYKKYIYIIIGHCQFSFASCNPNSPVHGSLSSSKSDALSTSFLRNRSTPAPIFALHGGASASILTSKPLSSSHRLSFKMKYVRPYTLYKSVEKKAIELILKDAIGIQLLGLNVLPYYFSISISNPYIDGAVHYGLVETNGRDVSKLTNVFQTLIPKYNIEAVVIGCRDAENMENLEEVNVNSVAYALCNTGKFEGLKFTYWDTRRIDPKFVEWISKDPNLPDDHPDNNLEDFHDRFSSVYTLQSYIHHFGKMAQRKDD